MLAEKRPRLASRSSCCRFCSTLPVMAGKASFALPLVFFGVLDDILFYDATKPRRVSLKRLAYDSQFLTSHKQKTLCPALSAGLLAGQLQDEMRQTSFTTPQYTSSRRPR